MDHISYPLDPTDRRMAELQRRGLGAVEEMARTGGQLRYTRDRARNYAKILAKAHKDGTTPPAWVLEEVGRLPDPTAETLVADSAEASAAAEHKRLRDTLIFELDALGHNQSQEARRVFVHTVEALIGYKRPA